MDARVRRGFRNAIAVVSVATVLVGFAPSVQAFPPRAVALGQRITDLLALRSQSPMVVPPVTLPALPKGWTALSSVPFLLQPGGTQAQTIITSWGYRAAPGPGPAAEIPPGGIMIQVFLLRSQDYGSPKVNLCATTPKTPEYPPLTPPLTLPRTTTHTLEGAPGVKEFRIFGRYRDVYDFEIRADIDTRRPLGPRWFTAEAVVHGLRFPTWPLRQTC